MAEHSLQAVKEQFDAIPQRIKDMEDFIALHLRRHRIRDDVKRMYQECDKVCKLQQSAYELLENEYEQVMADHEAVMRRLRDHTAKVLEQVVGERQRKIDEAKEDAAKIREAFVKTATQQMKTPVKVPGSATKALTHRMDNLHVSMATTPSQKISIQNYKESPLVKRTVRLNPIPLIFIEFQTEITPQQFDSIPKYMRGRETLYDLTQFMEAVVVPCFNEKYRLLHRQRNTVRQAELEMWKLYNEQVSYVPDRHFITPGDISRKLHKMVDKKIQNRLNMLRHIGVLQEKRVNSTACYIWNAS